MDLKIPHRRVTAIIHGRRKARAESRHLLDATKEST